MGPTFIKKQNLIIFKHSMFTYLKIFKKKDNSRNLMILKLYFNYL